MFDDFAWLIEYFVIWGTVFLVGGYVLCAIPVALKTMGLRGSVGAMFGFIGAGWAWYAFSHRETVTRGDFLLGILFA